MYLAHPVKGRQHNDCDAISWYTDSVKAAAKGAPKSKDWSFAAFSKDQLCQLVGYFTLRDEFTLLAVTGWIFLLFIKSEADQMRRKIPAENMSEMGRASSHSVLGPGMLRLRRR